MISEDARRDHIHLLAPIKVSGQEVGLSIEFHDALVDGTIVGRPDWLTPEKHPEILLAILKLKELVRMHGRD